MDYEPNLQDLLNISPRQLMEVNTDGARLLAKFCGGDAAFSSQQTEDLREQLFGLFDFVLDQGCSFYIIDYINEVCRDPQCTSSIPIEAYILEGAAVLDWCEIVLSCIKATIANSFGSLKERATICKQATRAEGVQLVLEGLLGMASYRDKVSNALKEAVELNRGLHVVLWCVSCDFINSEPIGVQHRSNEEWQKAFRSSPYMKECYCSELIIALGQSPNEYPYKSVRHALESIFFDARLPLGDAAWKNKCFLFGYFLLSAQLLSNLKRFQSHPFGLSFSEMHLVEGTVFFDDYQANRANEVVLKKALSRFLLSMPKVPFTLLGKLVNMGFSEAALQIWAGQQTTMKESASVAQISIIVKAKLQQGEVAFALDIIQTYCQKRSRETRSKSLEVLMTEVLEWGVLSNQMGKVIQLPFSQDEEAIFLAWSKKNWEDERYNIYVPMYFLARSRHYEAIQVVTLAEKEGKIERASGQVREVWLRIQQALLGPIQDMPKFMKDELQLLEPGTFGETPLKSGWLGRGEFPGIDPMDVSNPSPGISSQSSSARLDDPANIAPSDVPPSRISAQEQEKMETEEICGKRSHSTAFGLGTLKRMR